MTEEESNNSKMDVFISNNRNKIWHHLMQHVLEHKRKPNCSRHLSMGPLFATIRPKRLSSRIEKKLLNKFFTIKGQLISKANCRAVNSSKKRTNEFIFTTMRRVFVRFLEEIEDTKKITFQNYLAFKERTFGLQILERFSYLRTRILDVNLGKKNVISWNLEWQILFWSRYWVYRLFLLVFRKLEMFLLSMWKS